MERLTEVVYGNAQIKECGNDFCKETCEKFDEEKSCSNCPIQKAIEKLTEYEDLEEQGKLLRLPCKVGDTIWQSQKVFDEFPYLPYPIKVVGFSLCANGLYLDGIYGEDNRECSILISEIGKNVFLTKEQAELTLKEMEGENEA